MQYYSCVYILGHVESQNWFNPGGGLVEVGCIPLYLAKVPFWDNYYIVELTNKGMNLVDGSRV